MLGAKTVTTGARVRPPDQTRPRDRAVAWRFLVAAIVAAAALAACYLLLVRTPLGQRFDRAAYLGNKDSNVTIATLDRVALHQITGYSVAIVLVILVVVGLVRRRPLLGVCAAAAAGLTVVLVNVLKVHVFSAPPLGAHSSTFPSGHTAAAVACAMALVLVSPPAYRGAVAVIAGSYGWLTGAQVQVASWHRLSDAIGAAFLAFASVAAVAGVLAWVRPVRRDRRGPSRWAIVVLVAVAVAAAVWAGWGLTQVLGDLPSHPGPHADTGAIDHTAYLTSLAITVEIVVLLFLALLLLLGASDLDGAATTARRPWRLRRFEWTRSPSEPALGTRPVAPKPPASTGRRLRPE
jgi:membrane-associated phospholipid phosphatase